MGRTRYKRETLDRKVEDALKQTTRPRSEWSAVKASLAALVEGGEGLAMAPWRPAKVSPAVSRQLVKVDRLAYRLRDALVSLDYEVREAIERRSPNARLCAWSALFELSEALATKAGRPPVKMVGAVANTLAAAWRAEGLPFSTSDSAPWPAFVEYVFSVAGSEWPDQSGLVPLPNPRHHAKTEAGYAARVAAAENPRK